jgi:hypothetical protein
VEDFTNNVASARVTITQGEVTTEVYMARMIDRSMPNTPARHPDQQILREVAGLRTQNPEATVELTHMFTEREPCSPRGGGCQRALEANETLQPNQTTVFSIVRGGDGNTALAAIRNWWEARGH